MGKITRRDIIRFPDKIIRGDGKKTIEYIPTTVADKRVEDATYVSRLSSKDRVEIVGDLSLAIQCLMDEEDAEYILRVELARKHIQNVLDIILQINT
jgi:hypothetical protein